MPQSGETVPFQLYLEAHKRVPPRSVIWRWKDLDRQLREIPAGERGTIALSSPAGALAPQIAPGLSAVLQVVRPDEHTTPHAHSFWHIYFVVSGLGEVRTEGLSEASALSSGDVLFIAPWCDHVFANLSHEPLVLLALQNLPEMAERGALARREHGGAMELVCAKGDR